MLKKNIFLLASLGLIVSGCATNNRVNGDIGNKVDLSESGIPPYYLRYQNASKLETGQYISAGYGEDSSALLAMNKAALDAELNASKIVGSSSVKTITKRYLTSEDSQGPISGEDISSNKGYYSTTAEVVTPSTKVTPYYTIKRDLYQNGKNYNAYVLITNNKDLVNHGGIDSKSEYLKMQGELGVAQANNMKLEASQSVKKDASKNFNELNTEVK